MQRGTAELKPKRRWFTEDEIRTLVETNEPVFIPWQIIRPWAEQPRKYFNKKRLNALTGSIRAGEQCQVIKVMPVHGDHQHQFEITDGERRWRACRTNEKPVLCWVREYDSVHARYRDAVLSNFNRDEHTPLEVMAAVVRVRHSPDITALPKGRQIEAVAENFGRSVEWVNNYVKLSKLPHTMLRQIRSGRAKSKKRLPLAVAFRLASLPPTERTILWKHFKEGKEPVHTAHAQRKIDQIILKQGLHIERRGRNPSDELNLFERFLTKTEQNLTYLLDLSDRELETMLLPRNDQEHQRLVGRLDDAMESIDRLRRRLKQAKEASRFQTKQ